MIVEILSPTNWTYDRREKFEAYQAAGVPEYWIVDYRAKSLEIFILEKGAYVLAGRFSDGDAVKARQLREFEIEVKAIFQP